MSPLREALKLNSPFFSQQQLGGPNDTIGTCFCAYTINRVLSTSSNLQIGQRKYMQQECGQTPWPPLFQSLNTSLSKSITDSLLSGSENYLARSSGRHVLARCADLSPGDLVTSPGPSRTAALATENVDISTRARHCACDARNGKVCDGDAGCRCACWGTILRVFLSMVPLFLLFLVMWRNLYIPRNPAQ